MDLCMASLMMIYETSKICWRYVLIIKLHTDIVHLAIIQQFIK